MADREIKLACQCHVEELHFHQFEGETEINVALWKWAGYEGPQPWKWRLRHIWRIIRKGTPFEDDVVLSAADAHKLGTFLLWGPNVTFTAPPNGTATPTVTVAPGSTVAS